MHSIAKVLMWAWSALCALWGVIVMGAAFKTETPGHEVPAAAGLFAGAVAAAVPWVIGMVPLAIIWACCKPSVRVELQQRRGAYRRR